MRGKLSQKIDHVASGSYYSELLGGGVFARLLAVQVRATNIDNEVGNFIRNERLRSQVVQTIRKV